MITWCPDLGQKELGQILALERMPFVYKHVAVMPDCHLGKGSAVGTVFATDGAIIPAAVGVDIGCGMSAMRTNLKAVDLPENLDGLRQNIERSVPLGKGQFHREISPTLAPEIDALQQWENCPVGDSWMHQLGTLGSGNHFIEISLDSDQNVWIVLHSGSRGIGHRLATKHIKVAQKLMDAWYITLEDRDLAYLPVSAPEFGKYIDDVFWAQQYAKFNREQLMFLVHRELSMYIFHNPWQLLSLMSISCHHNFCQLERHYGKDVWVTRKGAIQAGLGTLGIIPGSMGTATFIVEGLGNRQSFQSAPHGAGRRFSRTEARKQYTIDDLDGAMAGISYRRSEELLDEIPGAYKDIHTVISQSSDLVLVWDELRQILNVKGD